MEHEHARPEPVANVHPAHDSAAHALADVFRVGAFVPGPTPLQALEAQQRFMSAIAAERARGRGRGGQRRAR